MPPSSAVYWNVLATARNYSVYCSIVNETVLFWMTMLSFKNVYAPCGMFVVLSVQAFLLLMFSWCFGKQQQPWTVSDVLFVDKCYNSDCHDFNIMAALCCWDANFPKCYQKLCQSSQRAIRRTDNYTSYTPLGPEKKSTFSIIILKSLSYDGSNGGYVLYPKLVTLRHSDGATHRRLLHTFILMLPKMVSIGVTFHHTCTSCLCAEINAI